MIRRGLETSIEVKETVANGVAKRVADGTASVVPDSAFIKGEGVIAIDAAGA